MSDQLTKEILRQNISDFSNAVSWLEHSYTICKEMINKQTYTVEEFDALDALTSRYARCTDFLINKILRSLDKLELENSGTIIDVINRAHKRGLINSTDELRTMKEVRNEITHEYVSAGLIALFHSVLKYTPILFKVAENTKKYCEKYL